MIVRRYQGRTEKDAIEQARRDLGLDVVLLLSKPDPDGDGVEIVVATRSSYEDDELYAEEEDPFRHASPAVFDPRPTKRRVVAPPPERAPSRRPTNTASTSAATGKAAASPATKTADPSTSSWLDRVRRELAREAYGGSTGSGKGRDVHATLTPITHRLREILREQEVEEVLLEMLLTTLHREIGDETSPEPKAIRKAIVKGLSGLVRVSNEIRTRDGLTVVACIGPTGVGKTTTIAKLAAYYRVRKRKRVALATADSYRIAGEAQLRTYADVLNVPCETAITPAEVEAIIRRYAGYDLLFLDTPGRSPRNRPQLKELAALLKAANPAETHLLVSSTTRMIDLREIAHGFYDLNPNRLLFTKLDESGAYGNVLNFAHHLQVPLSYFTTGQTVPDAIETATLDRLAGLLLRQRRPFYC